MAAGDAMTTQPAAAPEGGRYLFIIGAARSGTKLIRDLTAAHPLAASVPYDVNYVWRFGNEELAHDELVPEQLTGPARARMVRYFERYRQGREVVVEKTVSNCLRVPFVQAAFPNARFVSLIRDPVDIIESAWRQWQIPPRWGYILRKASTFPLAEAFGYARAYATRVVAAKVGGSSPKGTWGPRYRGIDEDLARFDLLEVCAIQASRCLQAASEGLSAVPAERLLRIRYEDLVGDPEQSLRRLWTFAELDPGAIEPASVCGNVTRAAIGRGWRELDRRQREVVLARVGPLRDGLGYAPPDGAVRGRRGRGAPTGAPDGASASGSGRAAPPPDSAVSGRPAAAPVPAGEGIDSRRFHYFWRGRVALYAILKALGIGPGDRVIVPGFTCVAVPNAVFYVGATPVYADIEPDTYNVSRATLEAHLTSEVRAIIVQSTFGLSPDLDPILELASDAGITVVEDCAHGLGGSYKGRPNGTVADAAFFSAQWSKPISTGLGGIAFTRHPSLDDRLGGLARRMPPPPIRDRVMLAAQLAVRPLADYPRLYYPAVDVYRWLTQKAGLRVGSSSFEELRGTAMPARFAQQMAPRQRRKWRRRLGGLAAVVARRRQHAARYDEFFAGTTIEPPARPDYAHHAMLRYTVRVPDSAATLRRARDLRLPLGNWFISPLHPVTGDLRDWGYQPDDCPNAERACREVVNLATDQPLSSRQLAALFPRIGGGRSPC